MTSDRRSHPTVRPHALALGVVARPGADKRLAFLGAPLAAEVASAMLQDALGALSTFPVRHRVVLVDEGDESLTRVPATWKRHALPGGEHPERHALAHLFGLGGEAALLVVADGPVMPLGELFDGLLGLAQPQSARAGEAPAGPPAALVGPLEGGGLFAIGLGGDDPQLLEAAAWEPGTSGADLERVAAARGLEVRRTAPTYLVDGPAALRRLKNDVIAGAFAPLCRKLLDRPDVERALAAAGA